MTLFENIKKLCEINGISGREQAVAQEILRQLDGLADEVKLDALGNVIAFKKGKAVPKKRILFSAHMDEVGLIVTGVTAEGLLRFDTVGGINSKVILGRQVMVGEKNIPGVIGAKGIHLLKESEREAAPEMDKLYLDIGAKDKAEALSMVSPGESVHFCGDYMEYGTDMIAAKAIDDRAGCAILLDMLQEELPYDAWFCFGVQEEVGGRGAKAAAYTVDPDIAIVVESTASGDVSGVEGAERVCVVGDGAVVSFMDRSTIYDRELYHLAFDAAKENQIPCQTKTRIAGGNDAGVIQSTRGGVRCMAISIPSRYIHSPSDAVKKSDVTAVRRLVSAVLEKVGSV